MRPSCPTSCWSAAARPSWRRFRRKPAGCPGQPTCVPPFRTRHIRFISTRKPPTSRTWGGRALIADEAIPLHLLLVGRSPSKLEAISKETGGLPWTTDLRSALSNPAYSIYFDAQTTDRRAEAVRAAIAAGKHVYCEKPVAVDLATALDLCRRAHRAGVKHGVVQDK